MRRRLLLGSALLLCACHASTPAESPDTARILPLKTLRLYETGVGYFERSGQLSATSELALPVPAAHVDDALKTLVVLGKDGDAAVTGIEFDSVVSEGMARALAGLPKQAGQPLSYQDLLHSLKGTLIDVRTNDGSFEARLMDVFQAPPSDPPRGQGAKSKKQDADDDDDVQTPDKERQVPWLLLLRDDGEIRKLEASKVEGIKPLDGSFARRISSAVDTLSVRAASTRRTLRVLANSQKPISVGYIAEVPVWRTSYRLVVESKTSPDSERAVLQGWALLHNDTDENWGGVKVELVSGRPDSFLFPLAAPRYSRRPLAEPESELSTVPQLVDKTADQIWGDHLDEESTVGYGSGTGSGYGYGSGHGALAPRMRMGSVNVSGSSTGESSELSIGNLATIAPAEGAESGALFNYTLGAPLVLRSHGSALVPFMQSSIAVRRLTWFSAPGETGRSSLRVTNTTRQTVPAGTIAIYENSGFAGESGLGRMKPKQRRFFSFGADLDVELELDKQKYDDETKRLEFKDDRFTEHFIRHHDRKYTLRNRSGRPRMAALVLNVVDNSKVNGADELDYDDESHKALAIFAIAPQKKLEKRLLIDEALATSTTLQGLSSEVLKKKLGSKLLSAEQRAALQEGVGRLEEAEAQSAKKAEAQSELKSVEEDLKRLRDHLAALGDKSGSPAAANPIVNRILAGEDRLSDLKKQIKALDSQHEDRLQAARKSLTKLGSEDD